MSNSTNAQAWYKQDATTRLSARVKSIQTINDEGTAADEMLTVSKVAIYALLIYGCLLSGLSYYHNFAPSFGHGTAIAMAVILAGIIEVGKSYFGTWTLRLIFFFGGGHFKSTPAQTFRFLGLVAFTAVTFWMSVINSTRGGAQLAKMLRDDRHGVEVFTPNTAEIDAQINSVTSGIAGNLGVTWKGTQTYQAQKTNSNLSSTLPALIKQKNDIIEQQRADYLARVSRADQNKNYAASLALASGGWVEVLLALALVLRVANERTLLARHPSPNSPVNTGSGGGGSNGGSSHRSFQPITFGGGQSAANNLVNPSPVFVSRRDTAVSQPAASDAVVSLQSFNFHLQNLSRELSNYDRGNGTRERVAMRISEALNGCIYHFSAATIDRQRKLYDYIASIGNDPFLIANTPYRDVTSLFEMRLAV